jgi:hypothetical protein
LLVRAAAAGVQQSDGNVAWLVQVGHARVEPLQLHLEWDSALQGGTCLYWPGFIVLQASGLRFRLVT